MESSEALRVQDKYERILSVFAGRLPVLEQRVLRSLMNDDANHEKLRHIIDNALANGIPWEDCTYSLLHFINTATLDFARQLFTSVFEVLPTEKAKSLAKESVLKMGLSSKNTALVYGEIDFASFASILERVNPKQDSVFVDLGHGTGKALICASLLFGFVFSRIHGIELVESLYHQSEELIASFKTAVVENSIYFNCSTNISICQGDMLVYETESGAEESKSVADERACIQGTYFDWGLADVVFANSTCFDEDLMQQLSGAATRKLRPGSIFISFTRPLSGIGSSFSLEGKFQYVMSWGTATCYIHKKL